MQAIDVEDLKNPVWRRNIDDMHQIMGITPLKDKEFVHCTDRRSFFSRAEIESYKHWEYAWALEVGNFQAGQKVLDCGCGRGFLQIYLAQKGLNMYSVDISSLKPRMIRKFWDFAHKYQLPLKEDTSSAMVALGKRYGVSLNFEKRNMATLSFSDNYFDTVYSISVLEHMDEGDDTKAMMEMARVLKPGGKLLLTVDYSPEKIKRKSYDQSDISRLVSASGLKVIDQINSVSKIDQNWDAHLQTLSKTFGKTMTISTVALILQKN